MTKGPVERTLPPRDGVVGSVARATGRHITAATQAGPIRYTSAGGQEYCTVGYLAMNLQGPRNMKELLSSLLSGKGKITHGTTHEPLQGWNLVVDVSCTREESMKLPQRMDRIAACLRKESVNLNKTVFLALYSGVGAEMDLISIMNQATQSITQFHPILVSFPTSEALKKCLNHLEGQPAPAAVQKGGRGGGASAKGGKGKVGRGGGAAAPTGGRGAGGIRVSERDLDKLASMVKGRIAGATKGGRGGGKGGKGGKGKVTQVADGITKRVKGGQLTFQRPGYKPY